MRREGLSMAKKAKPKAVEAAPTPAPEAPAKGKPSLGLVAAVRTNEGAVRAVAMTQAQSKVAEGIKASARPRQRNVFVIDPTLPCI